MVVNGELLGFGWSGECCGRGEDLKKIGGSVLKIDPNCAFLAAVSNRAQHELVGCHVMLLDGHTGPVPLVVVRMET